MTSKIPTILKKKTDGGQVKAGAASLFRRLGRLIYRSSYFTGKNAEILAYKVDRGLRSVFNVALSEIFKGAGDFARNLSEFKRSRAGRGEISVTRGVIEFAAGVSDTMSICREAFERGGFRSGFAVAGRFARRAAARFFSGKRAAFNYIMPVAAAFVLILTVYFWSNACFAISVTYDGKSLGIVGSEQTYRNAADEVEMNVSDASGSSFKLSSNVKFKMVLAKKSDLSDEDQIYNNIVMKSCDGVKTGYGLYVDNRLAGANSENGSIEAMLNEMTDKYKDDPQVQSVEFSQDVAVKAGVFPSSVFKTVSDIKDIVTAKKTSDIGGDDVSSLSASSGVFRLSLDPLYAMNLSTGSTVSKEDTIVAQSSQPVLSVKVVKNEIYTKAIPYSVKKVNSSKLKIGKTKVSVEGKDGTQQVVAAVTYVDGVKTGEDIISTVTTKESVTEKLLVGTKKTAKSSSSSSSGGSGIIGYAKNAIGVPYVSGGSSYSGFDCSGFTKYVYSKYGVSLPHSAAAQSAYGSYVSKSSLQAGDLVFFDTNGGHNSITHVGIYIGGGDFIDASSSRPHSVKVDSLDSSYYSRRYMTARRVLE